MSRLLRLWVSTPARGARAVSATATYGWCRAALAPAEASRPPPQPGQQVGSAGAGLSYMHNPSTDPLLHFTVGQLAEVAAERFPDRDAVVSVAEGVRLTYKDVLNEADRMAAGLRELGLQPGDRVAIWGPNSWRWIITKFAVARAGLISVDMNPLYREEEVLQCLKQAQVAGIVAAEGVRDVRYHDLLSRIIPELRSTVPGAIRSAVLPDLRVFVTLSDETLQGAVRFEDVLSAGTAERVQAIRSLQNKINPDSGSNIQFTSGTTGKPKAIVLTHKGIVNNSFGCGKRFNLKDKHHKMCVQVPLFHVFGSVVATSSAFHYGTTLVFPHPTYSPRHSVEAVDKERCTILTGTPTMYVDLVREVERSGTKLVSTELAVSGGAPITPEFVRRMMSTLGIKRLCSVYGMSETTALSFQGTEVDDIEQMANTVGRVSDHVEVKVVDENGHVVPFGTPGELWVRSYAAMKEYYRNPAANAETFQDGWIKTGDKFILQEDGYGRIVGRIKDMIIRGGENIFPKEVEDLLATHPDVAEAQVIGVSHERLGEEVCACVRVRDGATTVSAKQLRDFCEGKIADFKLPRYSTVLPEFPKTLSGKVQKYKLRELCEGLLKSKTLSDARTA